MRGTAYHYSVKLFSALLLFAVSAYASPRSLFDGKTLQGWEMSGPRRTASTENGQLRISGRGHAPNWVHTQAEFEDFQLRFEYKLAQWAEAAVLLRAPRTDRPQQAGLAIILAHDFHNETTPYITGAIAGAKSPLHTFPPSFEVWHTVEIQARGSRLKVVIDGITTQDLDLAADPLLEHRLRRGVIGFPDMGYAYSLRKIEIEDFGSPTRFVPLTGIAQWGKRGDSGEWQEHGDTIEGANGHSILYAPQEFGNFELTTAVRSHNRVNSGIFLRGQPTGPNRGFEVQIYSTVDSVYPTGSIYGRSRSTLQAELEERWFLLQIRVVGGTCRVWVDGEAVAAFDALPREVLAPGRVGLQIHLENASVEFRDLRIRPLP